MNAPPDDVGNASRHPKTSGEIATWLYETCSRVPSPFTTFQLSTAVLSGISAGPYDESRIQASLFELFGEGCVEVLFEVMARADDIQRVTEEDLRHVAEGRGDVDDTGAEKMEVELNDSGNEFSTTPEQEIERKAEIIDGGGIPTTEDYAVNTDDGALPTPLASTAAVIGLDIMPEPTIATPPVPPAQVAATFDEMDAAIKETIRDAQILQIDPPLPPARVAATYDKMKDEIPEFAEGTVERTHDDGPAPAAIRRGRIPQPTIAIQQPVRGQHLQPTTHSAIPPRQSTPPPPTDEESTLSPPDSEATPTPPLPGSTSAPHVDEESTPPPLTWEVEATLVQSTEATLLPLNSEPSSTPNNTPVVVYEATRVTNFKNYVILGLVLVIITTAGITGFLISIVNNGAAGENTPPSQETHSTLVPTSPSTTIFQSPAPLPFGRTEAAESPTMQIPVSMPVPVQIPAPAPMPGANTVPPTPKPSLNPMAQLQSSSLELVPDEKIVTHTSRLNVAIYGNTAVMGAAFNDNERGLVFVYVRDDSGEWRQQAKLVAPDGACGDRFGSSVGVYDDVVVIGANLDDDKGVDSGSAHLFRRNGDDWTHMAKLVAPDGAFKYRFGRSVAIYGNIVVIGAYGGSDSGVYGGSGSVHLFHANGDTWVHQAKIVAPNGVADKEFGINLGIFDETIIVGTQGDKTKGDKTGAAYAFVRVNDVWALQSMLVAPDEAVSDLFRRSVGIYGNTAIMGAYYIDDRGTKRGSAYLFLRNNDTWTYQTKLVAPDGAAVDRFGLSVGIYNDTIVIGAENDDSNGSNIGATHVYVQNGDTWKHHAKLSAPNHGFRFGLSVDVYNGTIISGSTSEVYVFSG